MLHGVNYIRLSLRFKRLI